MSFKYDTVYGIDEGLKTNKQTTLTRLGFLTFNIPYVIDHRNS